MAPCTVPAIPRGARVAVVAPAGPPDPRALSEGLAVLEALGLRAVVAPQVGARAGYLAGDDATRLAALQAALDDPDVAAVLCARGGYGTTRLLARLDPAGLAARPKPIVGFSDNTALLAFAVDTAGVVAVHGPNVTQLARVDAESHAAYVALLTGRRAVGSPLLSGLAVLRDGVSEGLLRGGNLSLLAALAGTPHAVRLAGSVLVVEDTNEPLYRIDRLFTQLRSLPDWTALRGLVLGEFTGIPDADGLAALLREVAETAPCPVVCGAPVGHGRRNWALPLGALVNLDTARRTLVLAAPAVAPPPDRHRGAVARAPQGVSPRDIGHPDVDELLEAAVRDGVTPGAALLVRHRGQTVLRRHVGFLARVPTPEPIVDGARFDLASLTKPIATATIAMRGVAAGWLDLERDVRGAVPWLAERPAWGGVRVRHLLQHASGLPDWAPLFALARRELPDAAPGDERIAALTRSYLADTPLAGPPGTTALYSDLGYLVLGTVLETLANAPLGALFRREVAAPLQMDDTGFRRVTAWDADPPGGERVAATEDCAFRARIVRGSVHDENAYALGGVAPHAGLFATLDDVGRWAGALLDAALGRRNALGLGAETVSRFFDAPAIGHATWALGFDRPSPGGSSAGRHFAPDAVGHLGFTGCSVWLDRRRELAVVLLTNRVHPDRHDVRIRALRPAVHDRVVEVLDA